VIPQEPRLNLYPDQGADAKAVADHPAALLTLPMGMGKTVIAVSAAQVMLAKRTFIVAPKNTFRSWERVVRRQHEDYINTELFQRLGSSTKDEKQAVANLWAGTDGYYIASWEWFRTRPMGYWDKLNVDFIVLDEVQRMANRKSKTFKQVQKLKAPHKLAMSGTPQGNKMEGFWTTLRWLWPDVTPRSFWRWAYQWLYVKKNEYLGFMEIGGELTPGALLKAQPKYLWRPETKRYDVVDKEIEIELKPSQKKLYNQLKKDHVVFLKNNPLTIDYEFHMRMRLRSITLGTPVVRDSGKVSYDEDTDSAALDALFDFIEDLADDDTVLVFTHSRDFAIVAAIRLMQAGISAYPWVGGRPQAERDATMASWGAPNGVRIIVAVPEAIAEGTDGLQDKCHIEFWLSESDNMMINEQAKKRLPRDGQKHIVTRARVIHDKTFDRQILDKHAQTKLELDESLRGAPDE
jgi:non-specific serine/threonine protein kinase